MRDLTPEWPWTDDGAMGPAQSTSPRADIEQTAGVAARCFRGTDGNMLIAYLRSLTLERVLGPDAGDSALRHLEGQRHLVRHLCQLIELGSKGLNLPFPSKGDRE